MKNRSLFFLSPRMMVSSFFFPGEPGGRVFSRFLRQNCARFACFADFCLLFRRLLGGVIGLGAAGALAGIARKMPRALADTRLTALNIGGAKAVALPAYGEYTYEKKNEEDSAWWLYYGRDEESFQVRMGAVIDDHAEIDGFFTGRIALQNTFEGRLSARRAQAPGIHGAVVAEGSL